MSAFTDLLNGPLYGVMRWEQWDVLCENIRSSGEAWYVYGVGHGVPDAPIAGSSLSCALDEIGALLKRDHEEDYLGIVYVDDLSNAALVKIYDPNNLGATCGSSGRDIPPGWVLSRHPPSQIASDIPVSNNRRRWWHGLLSKLTVT
ncbi:MAG TPA: hypothetical protein DCQ77_06270 [Betaproteobacteria bacterium]|nr:hypothetical protein [Betaproteobacteria bacterium]